MRAAVYRGVGRMAVEELPTPRVTPGTVLVRVKACALCGSDMRTFRHGHTAITRPTVLGHETVGEIIETAPDVTGYQAGQRVAVTPGVGCGRCGCCLSGWQNMCRRRQTISQHYNGGFAEYVLIPEAAVRGGNLNLLPDGLSWLEASLAEPLACVLNAQELLDIRLGQTVAVIGAGPLGCLHAEAARSRGAEKVFLINRSAARLDLARSYGFDAYLSSDACDCVQAVRDLTDGRGADVVIVAAGSAQAAVMGMEMAGRMGRVCMFAGLPKDDSMVSLDLNQAHYRQISVIGAFSSAPRHNALALSLIASGRIRVAPILTHAAPLERIEAAIAAAMSHQGMRVSISPSLDELEQELRELPHIQIVGA